MNWLKVCTTVTNGQNPIYFGVSYRILLGICHQMSHLHE